MCTSNLHTICAFSGPPPDITLGVPRSDVQVGHQMSVAGDLKSDAQIDHQIPVPGGLRSDVQIGHQISVAWVTTPPFLGGTLPCDLPHGAVDCVFI